MLFYVKKLLQYFLDPYVNLMVFGLLMCMDEVRHQLPSVYETYFAAKLILGPFT